MRKPVSLSINVDALIGNSVEDCISSALKIAESLNIMVATSINGVDIHVLPGSSVKQLLDRYTKDRKSL